MGETSGSMKTTVRERKFVLACPLIPDIAYEY